MRKWMHMACCACVLMACQKQEPTSWHTLQNVPLAKARLLITDFVADSLLTTSEGRLALSLNQTLFDYSLDSIFSIPADTAAKVFSVPVSGITIPPGVTLLNEQDDFTFTDLEIQLARAGISNGLLKVSASNTLESSLIFTYRVPGATQAGEILELIVEVPGSQNGMPGTYEVEISLGGYEVDLRGPSGNQYNTLATRFILSTPPDGAGTFVTNADQVNLTAVYSDISLAFAEGYFGNEILSIENERIGIDVFKEYAQTVINLEEAEAIIHFTNGFGADFRATIATLQAENSISGATSSLNGPLINSPINLTRALRSGDGLTAFTNSVVLNEQNSNITSVLTNLPDTIVFNGNFELNPLGNISNFNDFMVESSSLSAKIELQIPLSFSLQGLLLRDTVDIKLQDDATFPEGGSLYLLSTNGFPINAELRLFAMDPLGEKTALNQYLVALPDSGNPDTGWALLPGDGVSSLLKYTFPEGIIEHLLQQGRLLIEARFETVNYPEIVLIEEGQGIDVFISSQSMWTIEVE